MIEDKCKHKWILYVDVGIDSSRPSVYKCKKCAKIMTAAEVFQLETLVDIQGSQKWMNRIALGISLISLLVSILVAVLK